MHMVVVSMLMLLLIVYFHDSVYATLCNQGFWGFKGRHYRPFSPLIPACHAAFKSCITLLSSVVQGEATKSLPIMHLFKALEYFQEKKVCSPPRELFS